MKFDLQKAINEAFENAPDNNYQMAEDMPDESKDILDKFIPYTLDHLDIDDTPNIIFSTDRNDAPMTTGVFIPENNVIYVYVKNRAMSDWLKTLAHELTHYKQHVEGRIPENLEGRDKELEAEANIAAGDIIFEFAHSDEANQIIYDL